MVALTDPVLKACVRSVDDALAASVLTVFVVTVLLQVTVLGLAVTAQAARALPGCPATIAMDAAAKTASKEDLLPNESLPPKARRSRRDTDQRCIRHPCRQLSNLKLPADDSLRRIMSDLTAWVSRLGHNLGEIDAQDAVISRAD
ncbi:hypothetical protein [Bradyrhizobium sp. CCBAU 11357]|uniref:hypothetical protein n=1 Tax=Bradyrhizobium sp. CCBAU 11357 TaxID=1630808 RepID=UPI00230497D6|nr:hypothetical protein [Bradyrhizobium sp. CCBAU 11357]